MRHTDREYHHSLSQMRARMLQMAGLVEEMIAESVAALMTRDADLALAVIDKDSLVDSLELELDDLGKTTLVRWQPFASDLRFVVLAFKMVTDLERIGDLAVNISERALDLTASQHAFRSDDVEEMATIGRAMVRDAIDAFLLEDVTKAQAVIARDDIMDTAYSRTFEKILTGMMAAPSDIRLGVHTLSVAKWLERIGDHATNLAEHVIFVLDGKDVRHASQPNSDRAAAKKAVGNS